MTNTKSPLPETPSSPNGGEPGPAEKEPSRHVGAPGFSLQPIFSGRSRLINRIGIFIWFAAFIYFWQWWLRPEHIFSLGRYTVVTFTLLWVTIIPIYFIFLFARARRPAPDAPPPRHTRAAMIVTKAPSEPFSLVKKTLEAALDQNGLPHDTWLADEDPTPEVRDWCAQHGVRISTRKGIADYHRKEWPRRTRTKEGNLSYFYDHYGYGQYDFVSQFDADHAPEPDYLKHAIAPFADPAVGYVSAPSICDSNAAESWSARGRLYMEASLHGALQTGYNSGWAPLCIGSHYTVRTAALRSVGGLGPELAEDHSTTLLLNAGGWKGIHAVDAIAHGEGPETFADLATQEFQWSRSLVTILLKYSPTYIPRLPGHLRFQFLFSQLWYPMYSSFMALMFLLPIIALATGENFASVTFLDFQLHILPLSAAMLALAYWWRSTGVFRPANGKILSWEGMAFLFLRWPWSLLGALAAVWNHVSGSFIDFRITPKGSTDKPPIPFRIIAPYVFLSIAASVTAYLVKEPGTAAGFYIFNLLNAAIYGFLAVFLLYRHARENRLPIVSRSPAGALSVLSAIVIAASISAATYENSAKGVAAMMIGISVFSLTETVFPVAGAGMGRPGRPIIRYKLKWHGLSGNDRRVIQPKGADQHPAQQ